MAFERSVLARRRRIKVGLVRFLRESPFLTLVTAPVIYGLVVPFLLLDAALELASRTEQYWCPIRRAHRVRGAHDRYGRFFVYGDAEGFHMRLDALREELKRL